MGNSESDGDPERTVVVKSTGEGKYQHSVSVDGHSFLMDEPKSFGGDETGPTPYDLLCSALGACKAMTLRVYADHKKLPLDGVEVRVSHERVRAKDCDECESRTGNVDRFVCDITVHGDDLNEEQRSRLIQIADKCPVHKTLHGEVIVVTEELEEDF